MGKSTQLSRLEDWLVARGYDVVLASDAHTTFDDGQGAAARGREQRGRGSWLIHGDTSTT